MPGTRFQSWDFRARPDLQSSQTSGTVGERERRFFFVPPNGKAGLAYIGANREDEMPSFSDVKYVYDPQALKIMGAAFDSVCQAFPPEFDREVKRNRDPSETPCYLCNCNYIELIYSDDSCPNFPARETLLATMAL